MFSAFIPDIEAEATKNGGKERNEDEEEGKRVLRRKKKENEHAWREEKDRNIGQEEEKESKRVSGTVTEWNAVFCLN